MKIVIGYVAYHMSMIGMFAFGGLLGYALRWWEDAYKEAVENDVVSKK